MNPLEENLSAAWSVLTGRPPSTATAYRTRALSVEVNGSAVLVGLDTHDRRHLFIPIPSSTRLRQGLDGPGLMLRKRPLEDEATYQTYADLACLNPGIDDLFEELCHEVIEALQEGTSRPTKALYGVINRWRALFQASPAISAETVAGLFAELFVLKRMLAQDPSAHRTWTGPTGAPQDFLSHTMAIEVKATTRAEGRKLRIHGLDQLEPPAGGTLTVSWFRLERSETHDAIGLNDLVGDVLALADDEPAVLDLLAEIGYRRYDQSRYDDDRFRLLDERWYPVDEGFPRLSASALDGQWLPPRVTDIDYTVDLSGEPPVPLTESAVEELLNNFIGERA
ncbi:Uncharacterised protein [Kocuria rosea]|uniref:PD-(D/E)XK motif protein n=1 Tax=Kocuria rosea TaxID=1275 RepID=UPI000F6B4C30|nr:PD-(D/E)XK motif protein [Kocuria rosea]VEH41301.1 Uncharacterised protein [Kocuria rosea]